MRIRLTLLGGVGARLPSGEFLHLPSRKGQALLAYLALRPGLAHPREKLAAFLWGDVAGERARHSLRQALMALRATVAPAKPALLVEEGDTVAVNPKTLDVDVVAFERAMAEGTPEGFERASALYQGELLEGIDVDAPPFEEWLMSERARLRELAVEALAKLLTHQATAAPAEAAIRTALRLLSLEPSQEEVHRTLMRLYVRQGRRGAALAQYQICVGVLQRELGTEPEFATRQLYQTILSSRPASLVTDAAPAAAGLVQGLGPAESGPTELAPPVHVSETPFFGREAELQALSAALDAAQQGKGRVVVVVGEAGIGKTRLVSEAIAEASRSGYRILLGRAYESSQGFPFGPWADALRSGGVIRDLQREGDTNEPWRRELARLFPELGVTDAFVALGQESIAKLFEAFANTLESLVTSEPMMLVLEDLHWADETSLRLLSAVARRLADRRVLIVGTVRAEEVMVSPALRRALAELTRESRIVQLTLLPLSQPDTLALVRLLVGTRVEQVGEQVWKLTEGNPLAIVETVRSAREAPATGAPLSLSPLIAEAIGDRLDRLGERARQLATVAAVVGRTFEFELLRRAGGLGTEEAAEGVEELVGRRVLHLVGEHLDFTHDRVREVAYARVLPPRRQILHAAVGDALEVLYAGRLDEVCDRLAFHYSRSECTDKAVRYLSRSAERAAGAYAYAEAAAVLEEGVRQADRLVGEDRDRWVVDLALRRSFSLTFLGRWRDTLDLLVPHRAKVERLADPALASAYFFRIGMCHYYLGDQPEAFRHGQRALAEASHCSDPAHAGRAHHLLGLAAYYAGRFGESAEHYRDAVGFLERTQETHWLGQAYYLRSINLAFLGEFEAALETAGRLERLAAEVDDPRLACWVPYVSGMSHTIRGDSQAGIRDLQRAVNAAREPITVALVTARLGWAYLESGDEARAAPLLESAIALLEQVRYRSILAQTMAFLAEARLRGGHMEDAKTLATRALAAATEAAYPYGIASAHRALGRIAAADDVGAARDHLTAAAALFADMPAPVDLGWVSLALADLAGRHEEPAAAAVHLACAYRRFRALRVVSGLERTRALAEELGLPLPED